jgi:hypothetical protein
MALLRSGIDVEAGVDACVGAGRGATTFRAVGATQRSL